MLNCLFFQDESNNDNFKALSFKVKILVVGPILLRGLTLRACYTTLHSNFDIFLKWPLADGVILFDVFLNADSESPHMS